MGALELISDVVSARGHSARGLVRAIAVALDAHLPIQRIELGAGRAELIAGSWRDATELRGLRVLAPGLSVMARGAWPAYADDPAFRAALAQVIAAAEAHVQVVDRVASLSRQAHVANRELRADLDRREDVIARSPAMRAAMARAELVARHSTTVLLTGESGSGKEVVARAIHLRSSRGRRPMLHLNCGAIPEALVESELFGHERGAFTGAERAHAGVFERAHRSTLLLDEIGELPAAAQVKLLRVLQERRVRRVGGEADLEVDVRLIAATHRPLAAMVERGQFRADLYYRLDVFSIAVPPLRERRADLGPLVAALVAELAAAMGVPPPVIPRAALARLAAHEWPGNVRELRNVLETALIMGEGHALVLAEDLPRRTPVDAAPRFDAAVRVAIEDALRATRGKLYGTDGAAARLGLKPATLQSKMRKLGIQRLAFCGE